MKLPFFHHRPWARRVAGGLIGVVLLWALGWLLVPPLLRSQGEKIATEKLGRTVSIGRVDFRPWTLELSLHDVAIAGADGAESAGAQVQIQRLYIDAALQSLWRGAPVLDGIEIDQPSVRLTQLAPGHYDIDDVLARLQPTQEDAAASGPLEFALYNLVLRGGAVDFTDATVERTHTVRSLELKVPFLSNLPSQRQVKVAPHLSFLLNDSRFDALAEAVPFTESRKAEASIKISGLDIAPYLGYLPASVPVRLQAGVLDAQLRLAFEQAPSALLRLSGQLQLSQVQMTQPASPTPPAPLAQRDVLSFDALTVQVKDFQPLARRLHLGSVLLEAPHLYVQRSPSGRINLDMTSVASAPASAAQVPKKQVSKDTDWSLAIDRVAVRSAQVDWRDERLAIPAELGLRNAVLDASAIAWPLHQPLQFSGGMDITTPVSTLASAPARVLFSGSASEQQGQVASSVQALSLALVAPYLRQWLTPQLAATVTAEGGVAWQGAAVVAQVAHLTLDGVALTCTAPANCLPAAAPGVAMRGAASLAELKKLRIDDAQVNLARRSITVGKMALTQPRAGVERDAQGRWMFERWQVASTQSVAPAATERAQAPWSLQWGDMSIDAGSVAFRDAVPTVPVAFLVSALRVQLKDFAPLALAAKPSPLLVSARIGAGRADPGRLEYDGTLRLAPLSAQGRVLAAQLPLHAFEPYFADALQVRIRRADGSFRGQVQYAQAADGPQLQVKGDAALDDVRVHMAQVQAPAQSQDEADADADAGADTDAEAPFSRPRQLAPGDELLNWKSLQLRGVDVALTPGKPVSVAVQETALSDFFARVILQKTGRLNLQDLSKTPAAAAAAADAAASAPAVAPNATGVASAASAGAVDAAAPVIRMGPVLLTGGRVDFSDYFIQPNYSAKLSALSGRLSAFSSATSTTSTISATSASGEPPGAGDRADMADLELHGRVEGTASLEVVGRLNPLAQPLALDIQGHMRDLELPPLSPYTIKYAGHGIERGKLSMDVTYQIQPNGQLVASNKLVLNQLAFGDPVEGAPASLPVRLAVALLADRNGVIDMDLPIKGSLNDPEFRLAPVIFKILGNLIMKALTSPFSLLASALGGGDELGHVAFVPGSAALDAPARQQLDKVAKALQDRPALQMTVVGQASAEAEHSAWKRQRLQEMLLAQKRRAVLRSGQPADTATEVSASEYPALLKELYRRADMAKPRNMVGIAKELPQVQMEDLLLASISVPDNAMRELALARGVAVRDYLAQQPLPLERLFLGAVKMAPAEPSAAPSAPWAPHAELTLGAR